MVGAASLRAGRRRARRALSEPRPPRPSGRRARRWSRSADTGAAPWSRAPTSTSCCCTTARSRRPSPRCRSGCSTRSGTPASPSATPCGRRPRPSRWRPNGWMPRPPCSMPACSRGTTSLMRAAVDPVLDRLRADQDGFAEDLANDARERRERFGSTAYLLEPELKEGGGGLRDIHAFGWLQAVRGRSLEDDGLLRSAERAQLDAAEEFLTRVRSALHLQSGRKADRVLRDQQDDIARAMGFEDEPRLLAADGLMRAIFEHARAVDALTDDVIIRRSRTDSGAPVARRAGRCGRGVLAGRLVGRGGAAANGGRAGCPGGRRGGAVRVERHGPRRVPPAAPRGTAGRGRAACAGSDRAARPRDPRVGRRPLPPATRPLPPLHGGHAPAPGVRAHVSRARGARRGRPRRGRGGRSRP